MKRAEEAYLGETGRAYHEGKRGLPPETIPWVARVRAEKFAPFITAEDVLFEYGSGAGWNLAELKCRSRIACDVSDFLAPKVEQYGVKFLPDVDAQPNASCDVVLCHHALEHVPEPSAALRQMHRILKPDGRLLLYVPYETERRYMAYDPHEPNRHLYSWNTQTLAALVQTIGFKIESAEIGKYGYDRTAAAWALKTRMGETGFRFLRKLGQLVKPCWEVRVFARK
jgi:SAM-dependent methyltransferase